MEYKLLVPVRTTAAGKLVLRFGRLPSGKLTGLAFTSEDSLVRTLGLSQQWTDLSWELLLDMLMPLGVEHLSVDPVPNGESATGSAPRQAGPAWPQPAAAGLAADDRPAGPPLARTTVLGELELFGFDSAIPRKVMRIQLVPRQRSTPTRLPGSPAIRLVD